MPTASRNVRKARRVKRERTLAYRMADHLQNERDYARLIARSLEMELQRREKLASLEELTKILDEQVAQKVFDYLHAEPKIQNNKVEITRIPDEEPSANSSETTTS